MNAHFFIPYPPSVNALFANHRTAGRFKTSHYKEWITETGWQLKKQKVEKVTGPVAVSYFVHKPDRRPRDLSNLLKALDDVLVTFNLIEDDSMICAYDELRWAGKGDVVWCRIRKATDDERKDALL